MGILTDYMDTSVFPGGHRAYHGAFWVHPSGPGAYHGAFWVHPRGQVDYHGAFWVHPGGQVHLGDAGPFIHAFGCFSLEARDPIFFWIT